MRHKGHRLQKYTVLDNAIENINNISRRKNKVLYMYIKLLSYQNSHDYYYFSWIIVSFDYHMDELFPKKLTSLNDKICYSNKLNYGLILIQLLN